MPRCIEHEPGKQEQVPGVCPGVPGYCSLDNPGGLCTFECPVGKFFFRSFRAILLKSLLHTAICTSTSVKYNVSPCFIGEY